MYMVWRPLPLHRVSLLCVVATWTLLSVYLLVCAQAVESTSQETVLSLGSQLVRDRERSQLVLAWALLQRLL